jgi:hypothetical protein
MSMHDKLQHADKQQLEKELAFSLEFIANLKRFQALVPTLLKAVEKKKQAPATSVASSLSEDDFAFAGKFFSQLFRYGMVGITNVEILQEWIEEEQKTVALLQRKLSVQSLPVVQEKYYNAQSTLRQGQ